MTPDMTTDQWTGRHGGPAERRVLVVEDELLVGMDLAMLIEGWGYAADGPHPTVERALDAITRCIPDAALLDINLGGGRTSMPIAQRLHDLGTPFVLLTGYSSVTHGNCDPLSEAAARLRKPISERDLRNILAEVCPVTTEST